jgi:FlaA1/EpsC-like NDP-sugar epimerase
VRIRDLAEQLIRFYGYEPSKDIKIEYTGLRAGERIEERLFCAGETILPTEYPRINRLERRDGAPNELGSLLDLLAPCCRLVEGKEGLYRSRKALRAALKKAIPSLIVPDHEPEF